MTSDPKTNPEPAAKQVTLVSSALFVASYRELPRGIAERDLEGLVAGWVEESSPLPLHQMAWGFLFESSRKSGMRIFFYAASREQVFPGETNKSGPPDTPHYPAFCALRGLRFRKETWVTLLEDTCVTALRFPAGSTIPDQMVSRFRQAPGAADQPLDPWQAREEIMASLPGAESTPPNVEAGWVRASASLHGKKMRVQFHLQEQLRAGAAWKSWKTLELNTPLEILSADVRNREYLLAQAEGNKSSRRALSILFGLAACILILLGGEALLLQKTLETGQLEATIRERQPAVAQLEEIEAMTRAIDGVLLRDFDPLEWLMVINHSRPQEVHLTSFSHDGGQQVRLAGQSREISFINQFAEKLRADPRLETVTTSDVRTAQGGATFALTIDTGNIRAEMPPEQVEPDNGVEAGEAEEEA